MAKDILYTKILSDEASFQLVRTNPKLTGNIKITINSTGDMWLNSIDASDELSKDQYKRVAIDTSKSLPGNIHKFLNSGNTPNEIVFSLTENVDTEKTSKDYKDQFDFSNYFSGVKYFPSKRYEEKLSYFAPIYLKTDVPDYFIIFKVKDPINKKIDQLTAEYPYNKESYLKELFSKSSIIKTFDLSATSKVGKYLRNYITDPNFPTSSLNVSFDDDTLTTFNGILFNSGVFGSRGERLTDLYKSAYPLKQFEEQITLGFSRNGVIFPNILNLEFIFDDDTSANYDFNRYIGVYVNAIELSKIELDLERAYNERKNWENTPRLRREYFDHEETTLAQSNESGVIFPFKNSEVYLSDFKDIFKDQDNLFFNYIIDKNNNLYLPKLDDPYQIDYDDLSNELLSGKIRLSNTDIDFGNFIGPYNSFLQDKGSITSKKGHSFQYIKVKTSLQHLDSIKLYHPNGTRSDSNGKYELLTATLNYNVVSNFGDYYYYNDIDNIIGHDTFYFNGAGTTSEIAQAITGCLNNIRNRSFFAYQYDDYIFIKCSVTGNHDSQFSLEFNSPIVNYNSLIIADLEGNDLISANIKFEGGAKYSTNRLILNSGHIEKINNNISNILVKTEEDWSHINKVSKYIDLITEKNQETKESRKAAIDAFFNNAVAVLELNETPKIRYGEYVIKTKMRPAFGLLSFFPIKDFDFDFYSSEYLNFPNSDLYKYYYIPSNTTLLKGGQEYRVRGTGRIVIVETGSEYDDGSYFTLPVSTTNYSYSVLRGDPFVSFTDDNVSLGASLITPINDANKELEDFPGFFLLKDPDKVTSESESEDFHLRDKYLNGITETEYDFYKENYVKDFALRSKMIPYITKWAIEDGLDSRSNPYRLNTELVFGFNNFSPNHEDRTQNPANFTHEWFYIESKFNYLEDESTVKQNSYYFDTPFDLNKALTEPDYFIEYFSYTPTFNGKDVSDTQRRYSPISKNKIGEYQAFFKGYRITFRDVIDTATLGKNNKPIFNPNSTRFDQYKFTTLVRATKENIDDDNVAPITYKFIEHSTFKFIILLIEVNLGSIDKINEYWKSVESGSPQWLTVDNTNFLDLDAQLGQKFYETINGDYRISFETVDGLEISDINHTLLYSLKNKKYNNSLNNFSTVKLSSKVNLSISGAFVFPNIIGKITNPNTPNYPSLFGDEILFPNNSTFLIARNKLLNQNYFMDYEVSLIPQNLNKIESATDESIIMSTQDVILINDNGSISASIPVVLSQNYFRDYYNFKILAGGRGYFETLLEKISFSSFKKYTNELNPFIQYYSYENNGTLIQNTTPKYYAEIPNNQSIEKVDAIISQVDLNRPPNFAFNSVIGFTYERSTLDNTYEINRYDGGYDPIFKEVTKFSSTFNFTKNDISSLDLSNTKFNLYTGDFMDLRNFSHLKISDVKILELEADTAYLPKYEILSEISISRNNYFLFGSNWDHGYHFKYLTKQLSEPVPGSLRVEEDESFVGKIITVPTNIELEHFNLTILSDNEKLESVDLNKIEIVAKETSTGLDGYINVANAMTSYFLANGFTAKFNEFLVNSTQYIGLFNSIEDYVKEYIRLNIHKLYEIISVEFYTKPDPTLLTTRALPSLNTNGIEFVFLDDSDRDAGQYKLSKNLKINKFDRLVLKFSFNKELTGGILISPKIKIKYI